MQIGPAEVGKSNVTWTCNFLHWIENKVAFRCRHYSYPNSLNFSSLPHYAKSKSPFHNKKFQFWIFTNSLRKSLISVCWGIAKNGDNGDWVNEKMGEYANWENCLYNEWDKAYLGTRLKCCEIDIDLIFHKRRKGRIVNRIENGWRLGIMWLQMGA